MQSVSCSRHVISNRTQSFFLKNKYMSMYSAESPVDLNWVFFFFFLNICKAGGCGFHEINNSNSNNQTRYKQYDSLSIAKSDQMQTEFSHVRRT